MGTVSSSSSSMAECVLSSLRGKIIAAPESQKWRLQSYDDDTEYAYSYEQMDCEWTPLNSNLHMQGIKVKVHDPVPEAVVTVDPTETTLMLLELIKEKKKENRTSKEEMIRRMAMEKKQKRQECKMSGM